MQGLGPIGLGTAKLIMDDPDLDLCGAVDTYRYAGSHLGDIFGIGHGHYIVDSIDKVVLGSGSKVLVLATKSMLSDIEEDIAKAIERGMHVVSPAEELFYPEHVNKDFKERIDKLAEKKGVCVIGRGVNPGVLMDTYPMYVIRDYLLDKEMKLGDIKSIEICRTDDTIERRSSLLAKTGAGISDASFFDEMARSGKIGHIGLEMSATYIVHNLGIQYQNIGFLRVPVHAQHGVKPKNGSFIEERGISGISEQCEVFSVKGFPHLLLKLEMSVGAKSRNYVHITMLDGEEYMKDYSSIVNGDIATCRILHYLARNITTYGIAGLNRWNPPILPGRLLSS